MTLGKFSNEAHSTKKSTLGVRTISRTAYEAYPSFLRYSSGLSHPSDSLILSLR